TNPSPARTAAAAMARRRARRSSSFPTPRRRSSRQRRSIPAPASAAASIFACEQQRLFWGRTMTTTNATPTTTTSNSSTAQAAGAIGSQQLAGNFNTFLTLLTTQLQHQDPLSPLDTNQFTQQLVQFASVEQQINMNTSLSTLISLQQTAQLANGQASWNFAVASPASATINVSNASGQLVYSTTQAAQPGTQAFVWN